MKLGQKQELFMRLLPRLINKAHELGFEVRDVGKMSNKAIAFVCSLYHG